MKRLGGVSRADLFARLDRPELLPLPADPFAYSEWLTARVHPDQHVDYKNHWYSAPYTLIHEKVDVRVTAHTVELFTSVIASLPTFATTRSTSTRPTRDTGRRHTWR